VLFNSVQFVAFFVVMVVGHFALPHRYRWALLLAGSCYFYMAFIPVYILVLGLSIVIDYFAGIWIEDAPAWRRRTLLVVSLFANIGLLAVFKYYNFINENVAELAAVLGWNYGVSSLSIILPIGLSFHTFQAMSYTIEVYRGAQRAERHFGIYALYVMFFPQLVAGPIERPQNMLHQFRVPTTIDAVRWKSGLKQMLWGLFKKVAVADLVAPVVGTVYDSPERYSGPVLLLATVFFAFQIYCDFSGYSDIAIGCARLFGYDLMTNFRQPYFARSISEFWRRWHVSLSTWFRDYVYIPMGGNRVGPIRCAVNLLVVFALSGLWHGAAWTYVIWGALHGSYLVLSQWLQAPRAAAVRLLRLEAFPTMLAALQMSWVFLLVLVGWVFFRAGSVADAIHILTHLHHLDGLHRADLFVLGLPRFEMVVAFVTIGIVLLVEWLEAFRIEWIHRTWRGSRAFRWACLAACFYGIVLFGAFEKVQFIYFQF
jgi:alginate O-acetyltransferase complex protein AlgI